MSRGFKREQRVNDVVQTALAAIIHKEAEDFGFGIITITSVQVSHDLSFAKIFVSVLEEEKASTIIAALNNAAKSLRYSLANAVKLRITPELKFIYDDSIARGSRISSLINDALKK